MNFLLQTLQYIHVNTTFFNEFVCCRTVPIVNFIIIININFFKRQFLIFLEITIRI